MHANFNESNCAKGGTKMASDDEKKSINTKSNKQILIETLILMVIMLLLPFTNGVLNSLIQFAPIVYFFTERFIRKRTWREVGFNFRDTLTDIKDNWYFIALDVIVIQLLFVLVGYFILPEFLVHVKERLPMEVSRALIISIIIQLIIGTFIEEIIFRNLYQERLSWFIRPSFAILITSIIFGFVHFSKGSLLIVSVDIFGVMLDSIIYGVIFNRTKNIYASWFTHCLADIIGIIILLTLLG